MIEVAEIQARPEHVGPQIALNGVQYLLGCACGKHINIPREGVTADFRNQPEPLVGIVGKRTRRSIVIEVGLRTRVEVDVAEEPSDLKSWRQATPSPTVPRVVVPIRKNVRRLACRGCWHGKQARRCRGDAKITPRACCRYAIF